MGEDDHVRSLGTGFSEDTYIAGGGGADPLIRCLSNALGEADKSVACLLKDRNGMRDDYVTVKNNEGLGLKGKRKEEGDVRLTQWFL